MKRWGARTDTHHATIRDGLRDLKFQVWDCSALGSGFPDLLVLAKTGEFVLLEIKSDKSITHSKEVLTKDERRFWKLFEGGMLFIVHSLDDALDVMDAH